MAQAMVLLIYFRSKARIVFYTWSPIASSDNDCCAAAWRDSGDAWTLRLIGGGVLGHDCSDFRRKVRAMQPGYNIWIPKV